ncbi:lysylphosphatidylglycerol synthase transmembrane domain-containing protein [Halopiger goleimassiliensis]|uniref:lysylphosphatidylglycerol synthase transmembrane domain-containing protein n=1 Tax=Halopiger goleimassiliensis TaxID=1293048 RepID=UPI0006778B66|nr:lysylphosphatidylglycerol synthase transmembrane domain-containing protein [Halopiger goleimassiliensis]
MNDGGDHTAPEPTGDRSSRRFVGRLTRRHVTIAGTVLVVLGLLVAIREIDGGAVLADVTDADRRYLVAAAVAYALSWPLRGRRYGDVLSAMDHRLGTAFLTAAVFVSQTANLAIPARAGDAARAYVLKERDVPYTAGFASLTVERLFDLATIAALAGLATAWLAVQGDAGPLASAATDGARTALLAAGVVSTTAVGVGAVVVTAARSNRDLAAELRTHVGGSSRRDRALEAGLRFAGDVAVVARRPRALVTIGAASLAVWALDVLTAILVLAALDSGLALGPLVAVGTLAVSVGNLAKVLPLSQGGVGLYEAAFTALIVALTPVGASTALAAAIVDHALKNAITLVGGAASVASLGVSLTAATDEPGADRETGSFLGQPKR